MASCMALIRALKMSAASISSGETDATARATAEALIWSKSRSRRLGVTCLESLSQGSARPWGRITAPAYTGPARGPAPASSQPQTRAWPRSWAAVSSSHPGSVFLSILHLTRKNCVYSLPFCYIFY